MPKAENPALVEEQYNILEMLRSGAMDFSELALQADEVIGSDLWSGEMLAALEGVPFIVTGGTYRSGFQREVRGIKMVGDYVSLEIVIGDEKALAFRRVDMEKTPVRPLQVIRINDGSTGIRRQMTAYLVAKGFIVLNDTPIAEITTGGQMGESDYDIPVNYWKDVNIGDLAEDDEGNAVYDFRIPKGLSCPRGLRASSYRNEFGDGTTRYFG